MTCFARGPTLSSTSSLLSLTSMWYIPLLMDPVSSLSSQTTPSIPRCTNVLTSSHRLLLSLSRLQPFNFAVGFHLRRQRQQTCYPSARPRHPVGYRSRAVAAEGVPTAPSSGSTSGSPGSKLKSSRLSWNATPETSDQRLGLHTSTCLATRRDSVCALHPIHIVASRLVACLSCTSPVQPDRSCSRAPSLPTRRCPLCTCIRDVFGGVALKSSSASSSSRVTNSACWFRLTSQLS